MADMADMMNFLIVIALLTTSVVMLWTLKKLGISLKDTPLVVILLLPALLYLLTAGSIENFSVFGIDAKFKRIQSQTIEATSLSADLMMTSEETNSPNFVSETLKRECRPYFVIKVGSFPSRDYSNDDRDKVLQAARSVRRSLLCGSLRGLVVVDQDFRPLGMVKASALSELIAIRLEIVNSMLANGLSVVASKPFEEVITTQFGRTLTDPAFQAKSSLSDIVIVNERLTIRSTYEYLTAAAATTALLVDHHGRFKGLVSVSDVESWIVKELLEVPKPKE
jgi:hypothetical protein